MGTKKTAGSSIWRLGEFPKVSMNATATHIHIRCVDRASPRTWFCTKEREAAQKEKQHRIVSTIGITQPEYHKTQRRHCIALHCIARRSTRTRTHVHTQSIDSESTRTLFSHNE
uniref:Uncharacterized protein n=1 Tax=Pseudo-nitzschia australis TaxID=44445 RepID=A0A7S4ANF3_9STRA